MSSGHASGLRSRADTVQHRLTIHGPATAATNRGIFARVGTQKYQREQRSKENPEQSQHDQPKRARIVDALLPALGGAAKQVETSEN